MRREAFDRLFDEHAEPLLAFLVYRVGDRATAEDILSETFERALRRRRLFDARRGDERSWLYAIAVNLVRDQVRRTAGERRALAGVAALRRPIPPEDPVDRIERRDTVREALEALTEEEREAVALRFGADLTVPEIAALLGLALSTAEGRVYRALRKLRSVLS